MRKNKLVKVKTRLGSFECLFAPNHPEKGYTVTVPKLKGVVTFGKNLSEAKKMAQEAIELHCECLLREGLAEIKVRQFPDKPNRAKEYARL
ncbi:MAG: type II toxin-antitoxin system HicB family antitoxin [Candidatus Sungiibacteriota bacterium]